MSQISVLNLKQGENIFKVYVSYIVTNLSSGFRFLHWERVKD